MEQYLIYLRKSRKDIDAERQGSGETLARHEKALLELSKKLKLNVTAIYREIVSGETIAARPRMQQLLNEVETGLWSGVLVMEVERLARGDTKDQGTVAEAFKFGNAKIITPAKTYDPNNEFDEEYFEFGLFMSRREYKTINRRIQRGRIASVQEGKYIAGTAPYGYQKVKIKNGKGYTLKIIPEEAAVVRLIFDLYTTGEPDEAGTFHRLGLVRIARKLDALQIKPRLCQYWSHSSIKDILTNPTYMGKVRWQWRKVEKKMINGILVQSRTKDKNCMLIDGLHEAIISPELFESAQKVLSMKNNPPVKPNTTLENPLTGLIYCKSCGHLMTRAASSTKMNYPVMRCPNAYCKNISAPLNIIEDQLIESLKKWISDYELEWGGQENVKPETLSSSTKSAIIKLEAQLQLLNKQLSSTYDLLEQGIYSVEKFTERNTVLTSQLNLAENELQTLKDKYENELAYENTKYTFIPKMKNIIKVYNSFTDARAKNNMLKEVLEKVLYLKTERNGKGNRDNANFELTLFPLLPQN